MVELTYCMHAEQTLITSEREPNAGHVLINISLILIPSILLKWRDIVEMADNVATDDSESELQFVSTKSERLKLSWPIRGWSERSSPARTRRSVRQWQSADSDDGSVMSGTSSWRRTASAWSSGGSRCPPVTRTCRWLFPVMPLLHVTMWIVELFREQTWWAPPCSWPIAAPTQPGTTKSSSPSASR